MYETGSNAKKGSKSTNKSKLAKDFDGSAKFENGFDGSAIVRTYKFYIILVYRSPYICDRFPFILPYNFNNMGIFS